MNNPRSHRSTQRGPGFTFGLTELTKHEDGESGLELKASADGLEKLEVDAKVFDGTDYMGDSISKGIDIPIGWRLESGGTLSLKYEGLYKDFIPYAIDTKITGNSPNGWDHVNPDFSKGAWWACSNKEFWLERDKLGGDEEERCSGRVTFRTIPTI